MDEQQKNHVKKIKDQKMIHPRLMTICRETENWCNNNDIPYNWVCDEANLQSIMLFKRGRGRIDLPPTEINDLLNHLYPIVTNENLHIKMTRVRGGNILSFSLQAIAESEIDRILYETGEERVQMTLKDKIQEALMNTPSEVQSETLKEKLFKSASEIYEAQYHSATSGMNRSNQDSRQRMAHTRNTSFGGVEHKASPRAANRKKTPKKVTYEEIIDRVLGYKSTPTKNEFKKQLSESLKGMATATGQQPEDLFEKFGKSLEILGKQLNIGSIQDRLKEQGINWKKSNDGLSIIMYITNAETNAPQPIARISSETLENPGDFEEQLTNMLDYAKGEAPGTLKMKHEQLKNQEQTVRDIAQAVSQPDDQDEIRSQLQTPEAAAAQAASPKLDEPGMGSLETATRLAR